MTSECVASKPEPELAQAAEPRGGLRLPYGSSAFAELADVDLVFEGTSRIAVHSQILAVNSKVFAEMFSELKLKGQQQDSGGLLEVPLPGDTYKEVSTALHLRNLKLLAHCELLMIKVTDGDLWTHPAMSSNAVSRHSLLRMLRAFQAGLNQGGSRMGPRPQFGL